MNLNGITDTFVAHWDWHIREASSQLDVGPTLKPVYKKHDVIITHLYGNGSTISDSKSWSRKVPQIDAFFFWTT